MSDLISRRHLLESIKCVCTAGGIFEKPQVEYLKALSELVKHEPPIEEKEGVRIIWQHQIDDLIKEIKAESLGKWYTGRIDGKTDEVVLLKDVIDILEEAKK